MRIPISENGLTLPWAWAGADVDAAGNLYVALAFTAEAGVGPGPSLVAPEGTARGVVAKYDAHCQFQWRRLLGEQNTQIEGVAIDDDGRIAVARTYGDAESVPRTQLHTFDASGRQRWSLDVPNGTFWAAGEHNGLAWGRDGSLAVASLPGLCGTRTEFGHCIAKLDTHGRVLYSRWVTNSTTSGVSLDAAGNLYAAGFGWTDVSVGGLSFSFEASSVYAVKLGANGRARWLQAMPTNAEDDSVGFNGNQGFAAVVREGELLVASDGDGRPGETRVVDAWRLEANTGAERSLLRLPVGPEDSSGIPAYTVGPNGELVTMTYLNHSDPPKFWGNVPGTTRIVWWNADGSLARQIDQTETVYLTHGSIRVGSHGQIITTTTEYASETRAGATDLVVQRIGR